MTAITRYQKPLLPVKLSDLVKFALFGREKLVAVRAAMRAIDKLGMAKGVRDQKLEEGQELGGAVLDAEVRIGEFLKADEHRGGKSEYRTTRGGSSMPLPEGISYNLSSQCQQLAAHPEAIEAVKAEAKAEEDIPTRSAVLHRIRQDAQAKAIAEQEEKIRNLKPIEGEFDVIVIDPPWPMEKIEREVAPNQIGFDYPTMTEEELSALRIPTASNCHLFLWTTQKFLPMGFRLLDKWEFRYVCLFVWHKPGGFQPFGLPQFNCEFALYARKGTPRFADTKAFFTCLEAPRGKHSEKPDAFYDMIRRVTKGARLDMFSRREIEGFTCWGIGV